MLLITIAFSMHLSGEYHALHIIASSYPKPYLVLMPPCPTHQISIIVVVTSTLANRSSGSCNQRCTLLRSSGSRQRRWTVLKQRLDCCANVSFAGFRLLRTNAQVASVGQDGGEELSKRGAIVQTAAVRG